MDYIIGFGIRYSVASLELEDVRFRLPLYICISIYTFFGDVHFYIIRCKHTYQGVMYFLSYSYCVGVVDGVEA